MDRDRDMITKEWWQGGKETVNDGSVEYFKTSVGRSRNETVGYCITSVYVDGQQ